jgi:predicted dehydrogenase
MASKIRLGLVGAGTGSTWANRAHLPALPHSPDFELTAVCTTKPQSAELARSKHGAKLAFHDFKALAASPEIDTVAVVVRVPSHYEPTKAALEAGKHVYTEWPLGKTTAEAVELAALAKAKGVQTAVGLQSRVSPPLMYMKELIASGYVGEVMACRVSLMRDGVLERTSSRTWQRDITLGANTLTIATGHTIDALRFVVGNFAKVSCSITTQARQWYESDTQRTVDVTSPDNVVVSGQLVNGAVASLHVAAIPWAGSGYRMEIYGRKGTLVATGEDSPQLCEVTLYGAQDGNTLTELPAPPRFVYVPAELPKVSPYNIGQLYSAFAHAIRTGESRHPTFDTAVELHHFIDALRQASETGREVILT